MFSFVATELLVSLTLASPCTTPTLSISQAEWTTKFHGSFPWLAPELLVQPESVTPIRPSESSDIYSFGSIMLQVFLGSYQFSAKVNFCILGPYQQNSILLPDGTRHHHVHIQWNET